MIVGIDASNLRAGGGVTHLRELLRAADPGAHGVTRVVVWAGAATASQLPARPWLDLVRDPALDGALPARLAWQRTRLPALAAKSVDLLFAPGGTTTSRFHPSVVMSRNMLPFDPVERARYGLSWTRARLTLLRASQGRSFAQADGVIFLTEHAYQRVRASLATPPRRHAIIPHGVNERFRLGPRPQRALESCTRDDPFRVVYVSTVSPYKHQLTVVESVRALRAEGAPVRADFIGAEDPGPYARAFRARLRALDPAGDFLAYRGRLGADEIAEAYRAADVCAYASSCENLPNILLEAMAAGMPVACSDRGPMPELLVDAGEYFDPEDPRDLTRALRKLMASPELRARLAARAAARARAFTWARCADETFAFLGAVAAR